MKRLYISVIIILLFTVYGCGAKALKPSVSVYSLEDMNYPCIKVDFTDQVRYTGMSKIKKDNNLALLYQLDMPGYKIEVTKLYGLNNSTFSLESLPSLNDNPSKLYEITNPDIPDKSAVITLEDKNKDIILRGSVGYFIQSDRIVRVDIYRPVQKAGTFKFAGVEDWQNSTIGKRSIENMKQIVETVYNTLTTKECSNGNNLNSKWW